MTAGLDMLAFYNYQTFYKFIGELNYPLHTCPEWFFTELQTDHFRGSITFKLRAAHDLKNDFTLTGCSGGGPWLWTHSLLFLASVLQSPIKNKSERNE